MRSWRHSAAAGWARSIARETRSSIAREIVYLASDNTLTAATVNGEVARFEAGAARTLFAERPRPQVTLGDYPYDVSAAGQHFLVNTLVEETTSSAITLVVNWTATLKK
jgi:hypothetical protein